MRLTALVLSLCGLAALTTTLRGAKPQTPALEPAVNPKPISAQPALQQPRSAAPIRLTVAGEEKSAPVRLERAEVKLTVVGGLTQVTQTLVFHNPSRRTLEGELVFPLPEGAAVSGFALDVNGELVDAVPVEKEKARVVFEKEVRKGVDPGLLEQLEGNVFRTRIYPFPAGGSRTVRITYSTDQRTIPIRFGSQTPEGKVSVDIFGTAGARVFVGKQSLGLARQDDALWESTVALEPSRKDGEQDVTITVPEQSEPLVVTESFTRATHTRPESFFVVRDMPPVAKIERVAPKNIGIVWDASLSRRSADIARELALLQKHLAGHTLDVDVVVVRERAEPTRRFRVQGGDSRELIAFLKSQPFDGGTALGALSLARQDYWLWFTDGFSNLGAGLPRVAPQTPIFAVVTSDSANQPLLRHFCEQTGGALSEGSDPQALGRPHVTLLGVEGAGATDLQWQDGTVTGRLLAEKATLTLTYGLPGGQILARHAVPVQRSGASAQGVVARQWAAQRIGRLSLLPDQNHEALLALGHDFNLVTPGTSLLVLENLEQYVEHNIAPPRSRPALYDAWLGRETREQASKRTKDEQQLQRVLSQWNERVSWWKREFPRTAIRAKPREQDPSPTATLRTRNFADERPGFGGAGMMGGGRETTAAPAAPVALRLARPDVEAKKEAESADRYLSLYKPVVNQAPALGIAVKPWTPDTPYLKVLRAAGPEGAYRAYLAERERYAQTPAFYLDCAETLLQLGRREEGLRVLTSLADLQIEEAALLRVLAHRLAQLGERQLAAALFAKVLPLRDEEPQSYRDLALVLADLGQPERALELLHTVVMRHWDRFDGIEVIALTEANAILARFPTARHAFDKRLLTNLACDVRIVMTWDSDSSDMDLHVIEPTGEECFYSHPLTQVGGKLSRDFTNGYGPEDYQIRRAVPGVYKIQTNYFGSQEQKLTGGTTVQATIITNFGRSNERRQHLTLRLTQNKETVTIGEVKVGG